MELLELVWFEGGLVDCDGEGEVIEEHHSWNDPEVEERYIGLCVGLCFLFGVGISLADVVEFVNNFLIL